MRLPGLRRWVVATTAIGTLLTIIAGLTGPPAPGDDAPHDPSESAQEPPSAVVLPGSTPTQTSPGLVSALFPGGSVGVVVAGDDADAVAAAARAATRLHLPALPDGHALAATLDHLDPSFVLAVGTAVERRGVTRVEPGETDAHVERMLAVTPATDHRSDAIVLFADPAADPLGVASAEAAGALVLHAPGGDPRRDERTVRGLRHSAGHRLLAVGDAFARTLPYTLDAVHHAPPLPGGGLLVLPGRQLVALYGHPGSPALGVLGEQGLTASIERARRLAASYEEYTDVPVVPTFEIIATVASAEAGEDGDYSRESDPEMLRPWVDAAGEAGIYVLLDLQPGRTDFLTQAQRYESLLREPHVGLALDPEWRLEPQQRHLRQIGTVSAAEINRTADWLAALTREHTLPQKALVIHQFWTRMIGKRHLLDTSHPELAVIIHVDGHGTPAEKRSTWHTIREGAPPGVFWGWKNFHDEDSPMLDPAQTNRITPRPDLITYQ